MAADDSAAAPEDFGPYLVHERLGVGGMATVHRATEVGYEGFERVVALKRLLPHLAEDAGFVRAFVREAKLASLLNHVNVVKLYELGRVGAIYFISMEYIPGRDVRQILRQARKVAGPPPMNVTIALLLQLCEALDYSHNRTDDAGAPLGLVHRDVSPANLLVDPDGYLKVIDFGIAKAQIASLATATGRVKGKLAYMAPEAAAGMELDQRCDLFSVGVVAHELLVARPLFGGKSEYQTMVNVARAEVPLPSSMNPACPPELDAIVMRALARDRDQRYASAEALRDDLARLARQLRLSTTPADVVAWCDLAFATPMGPADTNDTSGRISRNSMPPAPSASVAASLVPRRASTPDVMGAAVADPAGGLGNLFAPDAADAIAISAVPDESAWGGEQPVSTGVPVVLDDVPDVSERMSRASGSVPIMTSASSSGSSVAITAPAPPGLRPLRRPSAPIVGAAMIERSRSGSGSLLLLLTGAVAAAVGIYYYL